MMTSQISDYNKKGPKINIFHIRHLFSFSRFLSFSGNYQGTNCTMTLEFGPFFENFNLANNFWTLSAWALIFHMIIPSDKTFCGYHYFWHCDFDLGVWPIFFQNFNLANNFWTVSSRALIFHINIPCDKTFPWVPLFFTLWPWPWSLTSFLKTLTLQITFEQWVLDLSYCTWAFLVTRSSNWFQDICNCHFGHFWNWPFTGTFVFHKHILFFIFFYHHLPLGHLQQTNDCLYDLFQLFSRYTLQ